MDQVVAEYKILQDKHDKIGAFLFQVRGWSITLVIASLFGAASTKAPPVLLLGLVAFVWAFYFMERWQARQRWSFGSRILRLERALSRMLRDQPYEGSKEIMRSLVRIPGLGYHLHEQGARNTFEKDGNWLFYVVQSLVVLGLLAYLWTQSPGPSDGQNGVTIIEYRSEPITNPGDSKSDSDKGDGKKTDAQPGKN